MLDSSHPTTKMVQQTGCVRWKIPSFAISTYTDPIHQDIIQLPKLLAVAFPRRHQHPWRPTRRHQPYQLKLLFLA